MNLRKTITGAAVALGSATVMLGLGGTAHAGVGAGAATNPDLPLALGDTASVSDMCKVDTNNPNGKVDCLNEGDYQILDAAAENLDADAIAGLLGYDSTPGQQGHAHVETGI